LFKENVFIFELCVMGFATAWGCDAGSSRCLRFLCSGSGCSRQMAGACWVVGASCGDVDERHDGNMTSLPVRLRKKTNLCF